MSDIAYKVIINKDGIDDIIFKTIMIKGNTGTSIDRIEKTSTLGNVDTYTVYLTDGSTAGTFTVTNSDASSANQNISDVYDSTHNYVAGDLCIHENVLWRATANTTGTWDATKWIPTTIDNVIGSLSSLTTSQQENIVSAINELTTYIPVWNNTASGSIATFDTSLALPLQDCTIAINAVQESGTPTPSSPKAISGFTGANITKCGKNFMSLNSVSLGGSNPRTTARIDIDTIPAGTYTLSFTNSGTGTTLGVQLFENSSGGTAVANFTTTGSYTFTLPTRAKSIYMFMTTQEYNDGKTININDFQIELGTKTAYEAYNGTTTAITWQDEAGTVYGGSLDVTSGVLTVTHGIITFDGSGDEIWNDGTIRYSIEIPDCKRTAGRLEVLCNRGVFASSGGSEGTVFVTNTFFYYYQPTSITSLADFKTWLGSNNLVVVYPLATPLTYQLTPTQISAIVGTNNVFTDTNGNTSVVYACSLKDYIDGQ